MNTLKVNITALVEVPDEFRLTPTNYGAFEISHKDDNGIIRRMLISSAQVYLKEPKAPKPAKRRREQQELIT